MNTQHLVYAVEVARCGSISQAADNLYIAQPNLIKAIKDLEGRLGFRIFQRTARGMVPTQQGRIFLEHARAIITQVAAVEALSHPQRQEAACLRIALSPGGYEAALSRYLSDHSIPLEICETQTEAALEGVERDSFDFALITCLRDREEALLDGAHRRGLVLTCLASVPGQVLLSCQSPLYKIDSLHHSDLSEMLQVATDDFLLLSDDPFSKNSEHALFLRSRLMALSFISQSVRSYAWTLPEDPALLNRFSLCQKTCTDAPEIKAFLALRTGQTLSATGQQVLCALYPAR